MVKELIINSNENDDEIFLVEDGVLLERYRDVNRNNRIEGNIYIGKVQNIIPGLQAAFVNIGESKNAFIHLKDILPKVDSVTEDSVNYESLNIKDFVKPKMPILVEIKRDSYNQKGPRASTHINLPGRLIVLLPNSTFITVSQKIEDSDERNRLIGIVKKALPDNMGAIIRTAAVGKSDDEIERDVSFLIDKWNEIISLEVSEDNLPRLIHKNDDLIDKIIMDLIDSGLDRVIVNSDVVKEKVDKKILEYGKSSIKVVFMEENLLDMYQLEKQILSSENRKVWLKNGGFITIDKTEALTAIDVNSAKFTGKEDLEKTALAVDKEAAVEIAKQIRLRDIGGIIVIDFIDLNHDESRQEVIDIFKRELKKDRSKVQIEGFTKLNLLELTRKHICSN